MSNQDGERFDTVEDLFQRFDEDARRRFVPAATLDIKSPADLEQARHTVNHAVNGGMVTAANLAKRSNVKASAISQFRNAKWKGSAGTEVKLAETLCKTIDRLLKQRDASDTDVGEDFVATTLAREIVITVEYAIKRRKMAAFVVGAGLGKSMALQHLRDETPGAVLVTILKSRGTPRSFLQLLARELGLPEDGRAEDVQDRIIGILRGSDRLVLIDEAHKLHTASLDCLREIWDATQTPIVLAGTPSLYQSMTSHRVGVLGTELMDQFYSRVGLYRDLSSLATGDKGRAITVSREDIKQLYGRRRVRLVRDGIEFLLRIANTPGCGGLRSCTDLVQIVLDLFPDEAVSAELLRQAMQTKLGLAEAAHRIQVAGAMRPSEESAVAAAG